MEVSEIQEKPSRHVVYAVLIPEKVKVSNEVMEVLSFGPKHPLKVEFDEMSLSAFFDECVTQLGNADAETINELFAAALWYRTVTRKGKGIRILDTTRLFLKKERLKKVPWAKSLVFISWRNVTTLRNSKR